MEKVYQGLAILLKYAPDGQRDLAADHDVIYCGPGDDVKISPEDKKELKRLGWFFSKEFDSWTKFC